MYMMNRIGRKFVIVRILYLLCIPVKTSLLVSVSPCCIGIASPSAAALAAPAEPIRELWRRPIGSAQSLALSPDGSRWAFVSWSGEVVSWIGDRLAWRRSVPGAEAVLLAGDGRAVVYTRLDARRRDLLILDASGRVAGRITIGGPVSTAALSPDGHSVAVGTAAGVVEIHPLVGRAAARRIPLSGMLQQLEYDSTGGLVATTVAPASIAALGVDGSVRWRHPALAGQEFRIGTPARAEGRGAFTVTAQVPAGEVDAADVAADGTGMVAAAEPDPNRIELIGFSGTGKPAWRQVLRGRDPHLAVMPASGGVVVAYERAERRRLVLRYERAIAFFSADGALLRDIGGMIYDPLLVCASAHGDAVLSLVSGNRFWLLSERGRNLWSYTAPAPIRLARASADGSAVAVVTRDNKLSFLKISPGSG
jgi:hypothetical protein